MISSILENEIEYNFFPLFILKFIIILLKNEYVNKNKKNKTLDFKF
jgi:hypothetical protein